MAKVSDPGGVQWSVFRRWGFRYWHAADDIRSGDFGEIIIDLLQIVVISPFWFIAKWFGVPWTIVIERNGTEVGEERVRGWRNSRRRIQQIVESAAAGTLTEVIVANLPTEMDLPPDMNITPEAWTKLAPETKATLWRMYNSGGLHRH